MAQKTHGSLHNQLYLVPVCSSYILVICRKNCSPISVLFSMRVSRCLNADFRTGLIQHTTFQRYASTDFQSNFLCSFERFLLHSVCNFDSVFSCVDERAFITRSAVETSLVYIQQGGS